MHMGWLEGWERTGRLRGPQQVVLRLELPQWQPEGVEGFPSENRIWSLIQNKELLKIPEPRNLGGSERLTYSISGK